MGARVGAIYCRGQRHKSQHVGMRRLHRSSFKVKAYDGVARRAGRSPSVARKLPKQMPRSPSQSAVVGKPWGVNGGSAEGASRGGAAPFTGPFCPRRRRPKQKKRKAAVPAGRTKPHLKGQALLNFFQSARRAYSRPPARRRRPKKKNGKSRRTRRAHKTTSQRTSPVLLS